MNLTQTGKQKNFKQYLKASLGHLIPKEILKRSKRGFVPPIIRWIGGDVYKNICNRLPNALKDYIDPNYTKKLVNNYDSQISNHKRIWTLIILSSWLKISAKNEPDLNLIELFDTVAVGGAMANTFLL